jgi:hypothetical protein
MPLPLDARKLRTLSFDNWRRAVESFLQQLDNRLASIGASAAGQVVGWPNTTIPAGWLRADGTVVAIDDHPDLYDVVGTSFNTGGEGAGNFRLPNYAAPFAGGVWIIKG